MRKPINTYETLFETVHWRQPALHSQKCFRQYHDSLQQRTKQKTGERDRQA
jgi:hypothetical protein